MAPTIESTPTIENGDASSTASTVNDTIDSTDNTSPIIEASDTRIPLLPVTSTTESSKVEVINGSVVVSNGSEKSDPPPVLIHVSGMSSSALPNGFVSTAAKVITSSTTSKGHRPVTLG